MQISAAHLQFGYTSILIIHCVGVKFVAVLLPRIMRFNKSTCAPRLATPERVLSGETSGDDEMLADQLMQRIENLAAQIGIPRKILDLKSKDHDAITTNALKEAKWSYAIPRLMKRAEC